MEKRELPDQVRSVMNIRHLSLRTEEAYIYWIKIAVREAGITKPASCHTFRHSFVTHVGLDYYE